MLGHSFCRLLTKEGEQALCVRAAYVTPSRASELSWNPRLGQHISFLAWQNAGILPQNGTPRMLKRSQEEASLSRYSRSLDLQQDVQALLVVPLQIDKKLVGLLEVGELCPGEHRAFTEEQIALVTAIAAQSTVLIHNMLLFQEARAARERLHASFQASSKLLSSQEPAEVLREIVEQARGAADASGVRIILRDEAGDPKIEVATPKRYQNRSFQVRWLRGVGVLLEVMRTGKPQIIPDIDKTSHEINPDLRGEGTRAFCCMPLFLLGETIGVMSFYYDQPRHFPDFEIEALQLYANQAATAYDSAQRLAQVSKAKRTAEMVAWATALGGAEVTLESIAQGTREAIGCAEVALYVYKQRVPGAKYASLGQPPKVVGVTSHTHAESLPEIAPGPLLSAFLADDEPYVLPNSLPGALTQELGKEWHIVMPLRIAEQKFGVMLIRYFTSHPFSPEELTSLELFARQVAVAIHNAQLYRQAQRSASALQALYEAGQAITSSLNAREILERIANQAWIPGYRDDHKIILNTWFKEGTTATRIAGHSEDAFVMTRVKSTDKIDLRSEKGERIGIVGRAMKTGKMQCVVEHIDKDPDYVRRYRDVKSELVVPIKVQNEVVGAINVEHADEYAFDQEDQQTMQALAAQASVAIQNAQHYEELQRTSKMVAARTVVAWVGMASTAWRHTIGNHATTIREQAELLHKDLDAGKPVDFLKEELRIIARLATDIRATPITAPLTTEEGVSSVFIHELLQEHFEQWRKRGMFKSIQLRLELAPDTPLTVRVSSEWFTRALDIVIENAVEAMAESRDRQLTVATRVFDKLVEIAISDTGRGIPSEIQEHLLKGRQIPKPAGAKGSGVGLLMAQTILQTYGGDIRLGPTGSWGTTMVLWLPLEHSILPPEVPVGAENFLLVSAQRESTWLHVLQEALAARATLTRVLADEAVGYIAQRS